MRQEILQHNEKFTAQKAYLKYQTGKYPAKQLIILTCMDTRLSELLPAALGLKNGDAKIIRNAGGCIQDPYGSELRSILTSIARLNVRKVLVMGHTDCGTEQLNGQDVLDVLKKMGIKEEAVEQAEQCREGINEWLEGFDEVRTAVRKSVELLKNHPLIPELIEIEGAVIDTETGRMEMLT
jgi:carbonic anhydrase